MRDSLLALLAGALLSASMPGEVSGVLAWIALAPLVVAVSGRSPLAAAGLGLLAGVVSTTITFRWILNVPLFGPAHGVLLAAWLGLFSAAWAAAVAWMGRARLPVVAWAPLAWVLLEGVRARAGFLALPWGSLAQTQHADLPLLQTAAVAGEPGMSFLVAAAGVGIARVVTARAWREAAAVAGLVAAAHAAGALSLALDAPSPALRVAIVQPSLSAAERETAEGYRGSVERLERLTREAGSGGPGLVVWPETAVRGLPAQGELRGRLERLAAEIGAPIIVGSSTTEKFVDEPEGAARTVRFNEAVLVAPPGRPPAPYRKTLLVPFAEELPLKGRVSWPGWLARGSYGISRGEGPRSFPLADGTRVAPAICWENLFAGYIRRAVLDRAELLVVLTNDSWAGRSAAPHQHNAASILRAAETGVPVAMASNAGPSIAVDRRGRVVARARGVLTSEVVTADVGLGAGSTPYARLGDPLAAAAVLAAGILLAAVAARPSPRGSGGPTRGERS